MSSGEVVQDASINLMRQELKKHHAYEQFKSIISDSFLETVLSYRKNGRPTTFDFNLKKLQKMLSTLVDLDFEDFLRNASPSILKNPLLYQTGYDDTGRPIAVINFNRYNPKWNEKELSDLQMSLLLSTYTIIEHNPNSQAVAITISNRMRTSLFAVKELQFLRKYSHISEAAFPERGYKQFNFVPTYLQTTLSIALKFLPASLREKQVLGSQAHVRSEFQKLCSDIYRILPKEIGGDGSEIEQNFEWTVKEDGRIVTKILSLEESQSANLVVLEDIEEKFISKHHVPTIMKDVDEKKEVLIPNGNRDADSKSLASLDYSVEETGESIVIENLKELIMPDTIELKGPSRKTESSFVFEMRHVAYKDKSNGIETVLLQNVNAHFISKETCAIIGAQRETQEALFSAIMGLRMIQHGGLYLNEGRLRKPSNRISAFVPAINTFNPYLTPRQAFYYMFKLLKSEEVAEDQLNELVSSELRRLRLVKCADIPLGDDHSRIIGPCQRKRLSIGLTAIFNPKVILLDEPYSGSYSRLICKTMREVADGDRIVIAIMNDTNYQDLLSFDSMVLFKGSHVVYHGTTKGFANYFENIVCWSASTAPNPLEFVLDRLEVSEEMELFEIWQDTDQSEFYTRTKVADNLVFLKESSEVEFKLFSVFKNLFGPLLLNKKALLRRTAFVLVANIVLGVVFYGEVDETSDSAYSITSFLFLLFAYSMAESAYSAHSQLSNLLPSLVRDYRNGLHHIHIIVLAFLMVHMVLVFLFSLIWLSSFFMVKFDSISLLHFLVLVILNSGFSAFLGLSLGTVQRKLADVLLSILITLQLLFSGFFLKLNRTPVYLRFLYYLSVPQYALNAALQSELDQTIFKDCSGLNQTLAELCYVDGAEYLLDYGVEESTSFRRNSLIMCLFLLMYISIFIIAITLRIKKDVQHF